MPGTTDEDFGLPHSSTDLAGQVALVTGATSGLGWRFAQVLASCGAAVAVTGRRADRLDALAAEISSAGGSCLPLPLDISEPARLSPAVDAIEAALGTVTILVNNAAIPDAQYATKMSVELVDQVIGTNLRAPFLLSSQVARRLITARLPGRIVNISSMGAHHYRGEASSLYSTTKAALERMTEALAIEWAQFHINVNAIAPGAFATEMLEAMVERFGEVSSAFPRHRLGHPAQLDSTLLYLVSPASEFVTGTIVKVDDGQNPR
jgi:NAD(P)-dependent dehydrogenase (short-subunit alcohol dehydrogenase family)